MVLLRNAKSCKSTAKTTREGGGGRGGAPLVLPVCRAEVCLEEPCKWLSEQRTELQKKKKKLAKVSFASERCLLGMRQSEPLT